MGAGASILEVPDELDADTAKELAGCKWNQTKFDDLAGDSGKITKAQWATAKEEEEGLAIAEMPVTDNIIASTATEVISAGLANAGMPVNEENTSPLTATEVVMASTAAEAAVGAAAEKPATAEEPTTAEQSATAKQPATAEQPTAAESPAATAAATADGALVVAASDPQKIAEVTVPTEVSLAAPVVLPSKPANAKKSEIHKGCFDYVKSMGPATPDLVKSVVCCTVMLASGKKVTKFADAQKFCRNKNAALRAVQGYDMASADRKLVQEAEKLYGKSHDDIEVIAKKSKVVAEMAQWNRSALGK